MEITENIDIIIVGAGICGLATALALHKKGIKSIVFEKSETLRTSGVGIIIMPNGWRALDELGVASMLRQTSIRIQSNGEMRCLQRMELIKTLAEELPPQTIRLGKKIVNVEYDHTTSYPLLHLHDGTILKSKIVIGCDGVNSIIAKEIGLGCPTKSFSTCAVRGFSYYEEGHQFGKKFLVWSTVQVGELPINDKLVYWFSTWKCPSHDYAKASKDQRVLREYVMKYVKGFHQQQVTELIEKSDVNSLLLTQIRYRAPWELLVGSLRRGTITVAGDAMHAMGPFLAQGGSLSLEDAIVLARCISQNMSKKTTKEKGTEKIMEEALDKYVKERKMRVFWVSLETYLIGRIIDTSSKILRFVYIFFRSYLFRDPDGSSRYDCGTL